MSLKDIWYLKYRPSRLEEIALEPDIKEKFYTWLRKDKSIPNLLLIGTAGTGKTSLANVIINELNAITLKMNASDERGIDVIRNKVKEFLSIPSGGRAKIVFLDEADGLTSDAQNILRALMEEYKDTRFILTGNYDKFIEPLKSRCYVIRFKALPKEEIVSICKKILDSEGVQYDDETVAFIVDKLYPQVRDIINTLQVNTIEKDGKLFLQRTDKLIKSSDTELIEEVFNLFTQGKLNDAHRLLVKNDFNNWYELYLYFFNKLTSDTQRLIIAEFMYRHSFSAIKDINFYAMMVALQNGFLPFALINNYTFDYVDISNI